jgi:hypothetical protein
MRKYIKAIAVMVGLLTLWGGLAAARAQGVYHHGYVNHHGGYVQPHWQSHPDHSYNNNWSVYPNMNPHTGAWGTHQPTWNDRYPNRY